jgi:hypothetical protein
MRRGFSMDRRIRDQLTFGDQRHFRAFDWACSRKFRFTATRTASRSAGRPPGFRVREVDIHSRRRTAKGGYGTEVYTRGLLDIFTIFFCAFDQRPLRLPARLAPSSPRWGAAGLRSSSAAVLQSQPRRTTRPVSWHPFRGAWNGPFARPAGRTDDSPMPARRRTTKAVIQPSDDWRRLVYCLLAPDRLITTPSRFISCRISRRAVHRPRSGLIR